ncbi:MAG TPA: protein kinase [Planctomycetota bacterium]|nr:protein kinase [Planctomycetota bacterium]
MPSPDDLNLARRVVAQGMCQRSEVEECLAAQHQSEQRGAPQGLSELLVERGFLTRTQLSRLVDPGTSAAGPVAGSSTSRLGPYELLLKLGEGGMGAVYKASDTRNGKVVAIKVLPRSKAKDEKFLKRFEMEARATFELDHPNIVHGYDIGHSDGYHYLVIEFVQGYDLCAMLEQRGRFSEPEALLILEQMAKALDHIHNEHLVHRDIKPENILIAQDGVAKLTDMGLTTDDPAKGRRRRLTEAGIAMGTPFYLSPEQIKGESEVDIRSDIYALGATTYEMITGRPPFEGDSPAVVMLKHLNEYVPSPHDLDRTISLNFCHLLERMMAKDPFHRYQTPYELLQDIRRVMKGKQPAGIRPPAGRSSIARPELHQDSQRVQPIKGTSSHELPVALPTPVPAPKTATVQSGSRNAAIQSSPRNVAAQSNPRNPAAGSNPRNAAVQSSPRNPAAGSNPRNLAAQIATPLNTPPPLRISDTRGPNDPGLRPPSTHKPKGSDPAIKAATAADTAPLPVRVSTARKVPTVRAPSVNFWLRACVAALVLTAVGVLVYFFVLNKKLPFFDSENGTKPHTTAPETSEK